MGLDLQGRSLGIGRKRPYTIGEHTDVGAAQSMYLSITLSPCENRGESMGLASRLEVAVVKEP